MKDLTIKNLVEFRRRKSETSKKNFVNALKKDKKQEGTDAGGGDYWISCLSAISNCFKSDSPQVIVDKREELEEKHDEEQRKQTKDMYKRNIDILYKYEDLDLKRWKPAKKITLLKKHKEDFVLTIKGIQVKATPHHVFTFQKNGLNETGAIWFVAKLNGFTKDELGMFTDILYQYLKIHYHKGHTLNPQYCIAVDVFNNFEVSYAQLAEGEIPRKLGSTLDDIRKLM